MSLISFVFTKAPSHHLDDLQRHTLDQVVTQSATVKCLTTCLTLNSLQDKKKKKSTNTSAIQSSLISKKAHLNTNVTHGAS